MTRICRWWYNSSFHTPLGGTPSNTTSADHSGPLDGFTCTCVRLGNCTMPCSWGECFASCGQWSGWSHRCFLNFGAYQIRQNRSRTCLCDSSDSNYTQVNVGSTCWQYKVCNTPWEFFRFMIFLFSCAILIKAFGLLTTCFFACSSRGSAGVVGSSDPTHRTASPQPVSSDPNVTTTAEI